MLLRFVRAPDEWRTAIAEYYSVDISGANRLFLQGMFQGRTTPGRRQDELPVLIGLKAEIASSVHFLEGTIAFHSEPDLPDASHSECTEGEAVPLHLGAVPRIPGEYPNGPSTECSRNEGANAHRLDF